ncbi:hypothetical protein ASZ90_001109 [hydrocarbon metagenome]|uniref:Uncharacterized protein n=1 Tax=hydrocarbon metagenome TaxID=938273 RepID=A0A0W8G7M2_9ZZZZ
MLENQALTRLGENNLFHNSKGHWTSCTGYGVPSGPYHGPREKFRM